MKTFTAKEIGSFDNAGRFYISAEFHTESSSVVRTPSRSWPYSQYKHIFTKKYAKQLAEKLGVDSIQILG